MNDAAGQRLSAANTASGDERRDRFDCEIPEDHFNESAGGGWSAVSGSAF
jgi:hypothetical protein